MGAGLLSEPQINQINQITQNIRVILAGVRENSGAGGTALHDRVELRK